MISGHNLGLAKLPSRVPMAMPLVSVSIVKAEQSRPMKRIIKANFILNAIFSFLFFKKVKFSSMTISILVLYLAVLCRQTSFGLYCRPNGPEVFVGSQVFDIKLNDLK